MRSRIFWRLPRDSGCCNSIAVLPKKVSLPVCCTVPLTSPLTTVEPICAAPPRLTVIGRDSPVSAEASTSIWPSLTMQSAGTAEPEARSTRSPGTTPPASMLFHTPSRLMVARGFSDAFRAATASAAFTVSYHPMVALMNWMARRMAMSIQFWMAASTITASQIMMGIGITSSLR